MYHVNFNSGGTSNIGMHHPAGGGGGGIISECKTSIFPMILFNLLILNVRMKMMLGIDVCDEQNVFCSFCFRSVL